MGFIASLPNWAIIGILCGIFGGLAGLVGGVLEKSGMKWGRFLPIIVVAATVSLANNGHLTQWIRVQALTQEQAGVLLKRQNPDLYAALESSFPEDYNQLTARFVEIMKGNASDSEVGGLAAEAMAVIRRKYATQVGMASDEEQAAIVDESIKFYEALLAADPMLCNSVAISGPSVLINRPGAERLKDMIEPQAVMVIRAAAHGLNAPQQRRAVKDEDWTEVGTGMYERGATDAQINAIGALDPKSPDLCPGLLLMMKTLNGVDSEAVKTVRAQFLVDMSAG